MTADLTPPPVADPPRKVPPWDPEPRRTAHGTLWQVTAGGTTVVRYADGAGSPALDAPRPHLHPLRTPGGVVVTDASPADHTWHLGLSIGVQDVAGANLWGGRTYLRGAGYTWRCDHGRIVHTAWTHRVTGDVGERLDWLGPDGSVLLTESRNLAWRGLDEGSWRLDVGMTLALPDGAAEPVALGSPGSNGREAAGYGGLFWRFPPCSAVDVRTPAGRGEEATHGSVPADGAPWLAWSARSHAPDGAGEFTAVLAPTDDATAQDRWFVRVTGYPGIGSALAWTEPLLVQPAAPVRRAFAVLVGDGRWSDDDVAAHLDRPAGTPTAPGEDPA